MNKYKYNIVPSDVEIVPMLPMKRSRQNVAKLIPGIYPT